MTIYGDRILLKIISSPAAKETNYGLMCNCLAPAVLAVRVQQSN